MNELRYTQSIFANPVAAAAAVLATFATALGACSSSATDDQGPSLESTSGAATQPVATRVRRRRRRLGEWRRSRWQ